MKLLLDTHILLWMAAEPEKLSAHALNLLEDLDNTLYFSAASIWEIAIKTGLERQDFKVNPREIRAQLLGKGLSEIAINGLHAISVGDLPAIHKDPFDRILLAQAMREDITLLTTDAILARYPGPLMVV
jgi:PIN domain nuclease of toxin-antitoxin system